jgi:hypothetical protein
MFVGIQTRALRMKSRRASFVNVFVLELVFFFREPSFGEVSFLAGVCSKVCAPSSAVAPLGLNARKANNRT